MNSINFSNNRINFYYKISVKATGGSLARIRRTGLLNINDHSGKAAVLNNNNNNKEKKEKTTWEVRGEDHGTIDAD